MKFILSFAVLILPLVLTGQFGGANNGNPPDIKWKELSNMSARIIFPQGLESKAKRVADVVDYLNKNNRASIGKSKGKIDIILQNQLTEANGFVTVAPFRSEFFTTAPQRSFLGTGDWLDMLAIHEYRHVMQLQYARQGATKIASLLFGDLGWISMGFLSIPFWFTEGDAVMQETLLSEGGRGRSGSFLAEFRAMHQAGVRYPYEKLRNGSFKSKLPGRYSLGYLLSQYGRNKYGNDFWKYISQDAVRYKGVLWPFSESLRKKTGKNVHKFFDEMIDSLYSQWDRDEKLVLRTVAEPKPVNKPISKNKIAYYLNPKFAGDKILTLRSGRDRIPAFYTIDSEGREKKLFDLGYHDSYFNFKNGKMVWTQYETDIRWKNRTFSVIYTYDFITKKKKRLTRKTKYFSPDINDDGTKILVVSSDEMMKYRVLVLDSKTGAVIHSVPNPENVFLSSPKWLNNEEIIAVAQFNQKNALVKININTGEISPVIDYTHNLILRPVAYGDYIYFAGDFSGIRNVFAVDIDSKNIYQVTDSRVLASHPDVSEDGKYLVYIEQQLNGFDIKKIKLDLNSMRKIILSEPVDRYVELSKLAETEGGSILDKIPEQNYVVKDYSHLKNALNFHSWYPAVQSINGSTGYGISLLSTNLLSTLDLRITPSIDVYGEKKLSTRLTWNKYFPKLNLGYDIAEFDYIRDNKPTRLLYNYYFTGVEIPLNMSRGAINRGITFKVDAGFQHYKPYNRQSSDIIDNNFVLTNTISFHNKRTVAYKQLNPRFGQELNVQLQGKSDHISLKNDYSVSMDAKLYFPGVARTHSLVFSGHMHRGSSKYYSIYSGNWIRGLSSVEKDVENVVRAEYGFPLFYPDIAFGSIAFVKRVRANMFFDYGFGINKSITSAGIELMSDIGLFNFGSVFSVPSGIRFSYLNDSSNNININIEFILFQITL